MTDEELKPFIGKKVTAKVKDFNDEYITLAGQLVTDGTTCGKPLYKILPYTAVLYLAGAFDRIAELGPKEKPEKAIPKGFIAVKNRLSPDKEITEYVKVDAIATVEHYFPYETINRLRCPLPF